MSSPSSSMTSQWKYDVFLSFSGVDTRNKFTSHLFAALERKGILTFIDNRLERGKLISSELLKTIEESRFAIIIFSINYASSSWCLDELAAILRCMKETGLTIFPIFYEVDPSDVQKQTGAFGQAITKHEDEENIEEVQKWREALKEVATLAGWHFQDGNEAELIKQVVEVISHKLNSKFLGFTKDLVGIKSSVEKLFTSCFGLMNKVRMIGIYGMGGLGKTTLAGAVYDKFSNCFEGSSFIANVREVSEKGDLISLQQQLLEDILGEKNSKIWNIYHGVEMIKNRLRGKKVLLVLDDVNQLDQLEKLAGEDGWFGFGSWIIITTRNKHLLVQHGVYNIYKPDVLNREDALKLFCLKAFKNENPKEDYKQLSQDIVHYAGGLPLALVTLGSFFMGRTMEEWKSALVDLKQIPQGKIFDTLKVSYDRLEERWKDIFLDIACFFRGKTEGRVIELLKYRGFEARIGIKVLMERSLITIENNRLWMHDLLQEMGIKIVQELHKKPRKRSRLWSFEDLLHVLKKDTEAEALQAVVLNRYEWERHDWNSETFSKAFSKMCNLRLLIIHNVHIPNGLNHVSNNLRFLQWIGYLSECLPSSFQPKELLELCLRDSKMKYLWKGVKYLENLKCMDLRNSKDLIETPDFTGVPRLERLHFRWCDNLVEIHPSIGQLSSLIVLDLEYCVSLIHLPRMSSKMESLKILKLCGCSKIRKIPEFKGIMRSLSELHLDKTTIEKLPSSIEFLTALTLLSLRDCQYLTCLPRNMDSLRSLEKLVVIGCSKLTYLPGHLWNIKCLEHDLSRTAFRQPLDRNVSVRCRSLSPTFKRIGYPSQCLPSSFQPKECEYLGLPKNLKRLTIYGCSKLEHLTIHGCSTLERLDLTECENLIKITSFKGIPGLEILDFNKSHNLIELPASIGNLTMLEELYLKGNSFKKFQLNLDDVIVNQLESLGKFAREHYQLGLGRQNIMTTTNEHLLVKHGVHKTYMNAEDCYSQEPSQALHGQSSLSQPWSQWPQYSESSVGVTFTILNRYLQGLRFPKNGCETSIERKENGFGIAFQIIIPGYEIPWWITHQRSGNSISIGLPPNWRNSKWMGFALCASLDASYSHISVEEFDLGETFGLKARVIARGDTRHSYYATEISCSTKLVAWHIWLLYLPCEDWFATAWSGEFNQIEVVFESSRPGLFVRKCGLSLVYKQDVEICTQTICSSNRITFEGCDGSHDEFDNLLRNCDDYNDNECSAICSSSEEIESCISSVNGVQISYPSHINVSHQKICYCPAQAPLNTTFTDENFGRRFWSCGKYKQNVNCGFFEWEDPEMCPYGRRVIHRLQGRLDELEKLLVVHHKENKNLRIALLFSWIAFAIIVIVLIWCNGARVEHKKMLP